MYIYYIFSLFSLFNLKLLIFKWKHKAQELEIETETETETENQTNSQLFVYQIVVKLNYLIQLFADIKQNKVNYQSLEQQKQDKLSLIT